MRLPFIWRTTHERAVDAKLREIRSLSSHLFMAEFELRRREQRIKKLERDLDSATKLFELPKLKYAIGEPDDRIIERAVAVTLDIKAQRSRERAAARDGCGSCAASHAKARTTRKAKKSTMKDPKPENGAMREAMQGLVLLNHIDQEIHRQHRQRLRRIDANYRLAVVLILGVAAMLLMIPMLMLAFR